MLMNSVATMVDVYLKHGSVIMKMIVEMVLMRKIVIILHVLMENSLVIIIGAFLCHRLVVTYVFCL